MAGEIQLQHSETGRTLYAQVRNPAGLVWNGTAFVAYNSANLSLYAVAMVEQGASSRYYLGNFPAAVTAAGDYPVSVFDRAGALPATADELVGAGVINWTGTAVASAGAVVLAPTGLNLVIPAEPSAKPTWGATHLNGWLSWLRALTANPMLQSPTQQVLRNFANTSNVATRPVSEDGATFTLSVGPWS